MITAQLMAPSVSNFAYISLLPIHQGFAGFVSDLIKATPAIVPGLFVGWLLQRRQIVAGFICGTIGYFIYYIAFEVCCISKITVGIFIYIVGLCTTVAIGNAFSAGTVQLLRGSIKAKSIYPIDSLGPILHLKTNKASKICLGLAIGVVIYANP